MISCCGAANDTGEVPLPAALPMARPIALPYRGTPIACPMPYPIRPKLPGNVFYSAHMAYPVSDSHCAYRGPMRPLVPCWHGGMYRLPYRWT
jgi:hypothetical protein